MSRKTALALVILSLPLVLSSCVQPSPPKAEYLDYEITKMHLEGIVVHFYFDIENPNPLPIEIAQYSYTIYINDREFMKEVQPGFNLPASGKKRVTIPVTLRYESVFGTALSVLELVAQGKTSISFRIDGKISAGAMGVYVQTPLQASGTIPIPKEINL